jgi:hypothetical protein
VCEFNFSGLPLHLRPKIFDENENIQIENGVGEENFTKVKLLNLKHANQVWLIGLLQPGEPFN